MSGHIGPPGCWFDGDARYTSCSALAHHGETLGLPQTGVPKKETTKGPGHWLVDLLTCKCGRVGSRKRRLSMKNVINYIKEDGLRNVAWPQPRHRSQMVGASGKEALLNGQLAVPRKSCMTTALGNRTYVKRMTGTRSRPQIMKQSPGHAPKAAQGSNK